MRIKSFEFNLRELAGAMGDFGTLLPLAIGYIAICGLEPSGLLIMIGLANIVSGLVYKLPMPIEPMKVIAVVAIAQQWTPSMVYASGFAMGIIWLIFALTGLIKWIEKFTPKSVIHGIQASLGILLAIEAFNMISTGWALGVISIFIVIILKNNRFAPAALVLMVVGFGMVYFEGNFQNISMPSFTIPQFTTFTFNELWQALFLAGFAQIPLTITNATLATSNLIRHYWPEKPVSAIHLSWNQGIMNTLLPFFGGMPLCHGAGGLASQYYFGARTGGANIIEGLIEICLGLFFSASIVGIFTFFPMAIIGGMMILVGIELTKFAWSAKFSIDIIPLVITVIVALLTNMAIGFISGITIHYTIKFFNGTNKRIKQL
jgi:MFS superfamily sulfate permease-like transporter